MNINMKLMYKWIINEERNKYEHEGIVYEWMINEWKSECIRLMELTLV